MNPTPYMPYGRPRPSYSSKSPGIPTTSAEMEKPATMPQSQYSSLTKSQRRQLADPLGRDRFIEYIPFKPLFEF